MALINCPECSKEISDQCSACPHCGYPIKTSLHENEQSECVTSPRKPFYKRIWPWIIILVVIIAIGVSVIFLLNRNTKPKLDAEGSPVFVELTDEVYTNATKYKGYYIKIKGQVFQVVGDDGNSKSIQVWLDPETCEQNIIIHYTSGIALKQGDYISCSGYIDSVEKYKNTFGATVYAPVVRSSDLTQTTYIDVMAPTAETITLENLTYKKSGYSISLEKVEFAKNETRIYATAVNNGKTTLYINDAIIIQDLKQIQSISNSEANYEELPRELVTGASCSGIFVFPAMSTKDFRFTVDIHSDDDEELLDDFVFLIGKNTTDILDFGYKTAVKTTIDFLAGEVDNVEKLLPKALQESISRTYNISKEEIMSSIVYQYSPTDIQINLSITFENRLAQVQLKSFIQGINSRYSAAYDFNLDTQSVSDGYRLTVAISTPDGEYETLDCVMLKIEDNWYWVSVADNESPWFLTGPFTPAA